MTTTKGKFSISKSDIFNAFDIGFRNWWAVFLTGSRNNLQNRPLQLVAEIAPSSFAIK